MRAWLYDTLTEDVNLQSMLGGVEDIKHRIVPRASQASINLPRPFIIYGLGNDTNEQLSEDPDHEAHRQFSQVWIHDETGDYTLIDRLIPMVKAALVGKGDPDHNVLTTIWLENSQEFNSQQYNTLFRYLRFQHIIAKGVPTS